MDNEEVNFANKNRIKWNNITFSKILKDAKFFDKKNDLLENTFNTYDFQSLSPKGFDYNWNRAFFQHPEMVMNEWKEKFNYTFENNKHMFDLIPPENVREEAKNWKIQYAYNSHFFRCDEFKTNHDGMHIVFSGCSNTEGVGLNISNAWPTVLYDWLKQKNNLSGYFNLGRAGHGHVKIISDFINYVNNYGAPQYLFILMPNLLRRFVWNNEKDQGWHFMQNDPITDININTFSQQYNSKEYQQSLPMFIYNWALFENYCKSIGTKLVWSTWDQYDSIVYHNSNFFNESLFLIESMDLDYIKIKRPDLNLEKDDINARDLHPGKLQHLKWAESFYSNIIKINKGDFNV